MKLFCILLATFFFTVGSSESILTCLHDANIPSRWVDMSRSCTKGLEEQLHKEIQASRTYLAMGAQFAEYSYNRLGFSEFFFKSANEEREHGIKILEYLLMRGESAVDFNSLMNMLMDPVSASWSNGLTALTSALDLETNVTRSIHKVIHTCEEDSKFNDYHLVDYLTTEFLDEQYKGQRDLAGKISTLSKMNYELGEFLFDKRLLKGEV
ncbi:ferritin 1 heavy chain [Megalopta genalis]|uniref:ferritin 1 heavy chain n=1 Tax=Megalopta genalis TaxID=115081 RepID=UPI003FD06DDA